MKNDLQLKVFSKVSLVSSNLVAELLKWCAGEHQTSTNLASFTWNLVHSLTSLALISESNRNGPKNN